MKHLPDILMTFISVCIYFYSLEWSYNLLESLTIIDKYIILTPFLIGVWLPLLKIQDIIIKRWKAHEDLNYKLNMYDNINTW